MGSDQSKSCGHVGKTRSRNLSHRSRCLRRHPACFVSHPVHSLPALTMCRKNFQFHCSRRRHRHRCRRPQRRRRRRRLKYSRRTDGRTDRGIFCAFIVVIPSSSFLCKDNDLNIPETREREAGLESIVSSSRGVFQHTKFKLALFPTLGLLHLKTGCLSCSTQ